MIVKKHRLHNIGLLASLWSIVLLAYTKNYNFFYLFAASFAMLIYAKGFLIIEEVMALFSHVLSYLRVGILVLLSVIISKLLLEAYLGLPKNFVGITLGILLIIVGILFSFAIGVISVFIQSLRLHWLEFFSSYEFSGKKFEPFGYKKEYLYSL
jgi:V/A-type H+-transporting ATPase subunit I